MFTKILHRPAFAIVMLITWLHRYVLVVMAYSYLASPFIGMAITRLRHRPATPEIEDGRARGETPDDTRRSVHR